jgi:hypothetical protein
VTRPGPLATYRPPAPAVEEERELTLRPVSVREAKLGQTGLTVGEVVDALFKTRLIDGPALTRPGDLFPPRPLVAECLGLTDDDAVRVINQLNWACLIYLDRQIGTFRWSISPPV